MDLAAVSLLIAQQLIAQNNVALAMIQQNAAAQQAVGDMLMQSLGVTPSGRGLSVNIAA